MISLHTVTIDHLLDTAWDLQTVETYCMNCKNFDVHFSCPHHQFNIPDYLHQFRYALIAVQSIAFDPTGPMTLTDYFYSHKSCLSQVLMSFETEYPESRALLSGQCQNCQPACETTSHVSCPNPNLLRYSFESLGFNVATMTKVYFDKELTFANDEVQLIYGYLLKEPLTDMEQNILQDQLQRCEEI